MKFNRLLLGIFSLATLTASSMVMPPIASAAPGICVCTTSQAQPFQGQKSRSSVNFSTQRCTSRIIWTAPLGVRFNVVQDISAGKDLVWIANATNLQRTRNPNEGKLYIANPSGAQKDFQVCANNR